MRVMVIGASSDRSKFGNKAVRAFLRRGHTVLPVNPAGGMIEGLEAFVAVDTPPGPIDVATLYVPPRVAIGVLAAVGQRGDVREIWLNPGVDSAEVVAAAEGTGIVVRVQCSIVAIGESPASYP